MDAATEFLNKKYEEPTNSIIAKMKGLLKTIITEKDRKEYEQIHNKLWDNKISGISSF